MAQRSIPCPHCGTQIDPREDSCPWCGTKRPSLWARLTGGGARGDGDRFVKAIIAANVAYFLLSLVVSGRGEWSANPLSFLSPDQRSLMLLGATGSVPVLSFGRFWTLISASYLHGGLLHIFFNMMALRQIGPWVSAEFGANRMFAIYTLSGVIGYVASCLAGVSVTIGASASVCGLIGALFYFGKARGGSYGAAVSREVSGWLISLVLFGLIMPGINNWGHGGGVVGGVVLARVLGFRAQSRDSAGQRLLALACAVATVLALLWGGLLAVTVIFL
ncbi:rhomboid family intramembrane serine protease [Geomonas silvestris]|uniref:Rhomboid family intramembrane serine protease n=1 Tax=Geomonas silvestris TaxID=2740184 RepID=A0A6V8MI77_9BACT|nr:rhomboid family intramembrane serine protease [Geomonas silvestris]GFO59715.1 rhomboid family intramembrane serine protease [Geomonas silvestris]